MGGAADEERKPSSDEPDAPHYDTLLAFIHIPRSGGGTLSTAIAGSYARLKGAGNVQKSPEKARHKLQMVADNPGRWGAVGDHAPYGLFRRFLPPETLYITVLRDPVQRVLSHYAFHTRAGVDKLSAVWDRLIELDAAERASDPDTKPAGAAEAPEKSLQAGLAHGITIYDNLATRFLWGGESIYGELPADALERAKENVSDFTFVGITERFDESVVLLGRELQVGLMPYRLRHVNPDRETEQVPDQLLEKIREHNALDLELYRYAAELFEAKAASTAGLAEDVEKLRELSAAAEEEAAEAAAANGEPPPSARAAAKAERRARRVAKAEDAAKSEPKAGARPTKAERRAKRAAEAKSEGTSKSKPNARAAAKAKRREKPAAQAEGAAQSEPKAGRRAAKAERRAKRTVEEGAPSRERPKRARRQTGSA